MEQLLYQQKSQQMTFPSIFSQRTLEGIYPLSPVLATLYCFYPSGYVIAIHNEIIEYDGNTYFEISDPKKLSYYGPLHLFYNQQPIARKSRQQPQDYDDWIGIDAQRFKPYQSWINRDGTCGMLSATVLLAYYQDYIDTNIVHPRLREPFSKDPEKLYGVLLNYIKTLMIKGTNAADLAVGLNRYFRDYKVHDRLPYTFRARFKMLTTFGIMKPLLEANIPKPAIIGLFRWLGSPKNYLNHWVVAYAYRQELGQTFYQIHDNHGRYKAIIDVRWTSSVVRLTRKLK